MQDDRAAIAEVEDVSMSNVVISAAKPEIPEVKDADGNIIQQHQEAIPQIMMQGGIVEKGTPAVPAFRSFRTRIMENNTLTPDEKFEKMDRERQVCSFISRHIDPNMRQMTEDITNMKDMYSALKTLSYNPSIEMSEVHLDRLTNLKWINLKDEISVIQTFKSIVSDLETGEDDKICNKMQMMFLIKTWPISLKARKDSMRFRHGNKLTLAIIVDEMRAIANEYQAEDKLGVHQVNLLEGSKRPRSQFEEDVMAELMFLKKARTDEERPNGKLTSLSGRSHGRFDTNT